VLDQYNIDPDDREEFITLVQKCLNLSKEQYKVVDFDDMVYLPNVLEVPVQKFDFCNFR